MIEVRVLGPVELIGEDEVCIYIDGYECNDDLVELVAIELDEDLCDDVAGILSLEPADCDTASYTGSSDGLYDEEFMDKICVCIHFKNQPDFEDFLDLCSDMGLDNVDSVHDYYIGHFTSNREFCEHFLDYELSQTDSLIENNINWDSLYDEISYDIHSSGKHYARAH